MKRSKKQRRKFITWGLFWVFSAVLFINNTTDLLDKYEFSYSINMISWIGIVGSLMYLLWKKSTGEI